MTTLSSQEVTCAICGATSAQTGIGSTNQFGSPDLDLRPPELMRSTMPYWLQVCPSCGYSAPDIATAAAGAAEALHAPAYVLQQQDDGYPELARRFLCWALIQESEGQVAEAGWAVLRAAWACDDAAQPEPAGRCRKRAITLLEQARADGCLMQEAGADEAVLADLARRSGQFARAETLCLRGLSQNPGEVIGQVLQFELAQAQRQDRACHTIADAVAAAGGQASQRTV